MIELVPSILLVSVYLQSQGTKATGVDYLIEEILGHTRNPGIPLGTSDCFLVIHKSLGRKLALQITGKIGVDLARELSPGISLMGPDGSLWAIKLIQ